MSEQGLGTGLRHRVRPSGFTLLQFIISAGTGLVGVAVLLAAGAALGLALAGAGLLAVLVVAAWFIAASVRDGERPVRRGGRPSA